MKTLYAVLFSLCVVAQVYAGTENVTLMAEYCKFAVDVNVPSFRSWNISFTEQLKADVTLALRVQTGDEISQFTTTPNYQSGPVIFNYGPSKLGVYDFKGSITAQGILQNSEGMTPFMVVIPVKQISPYDSLQWITNGDDEIQGLDCSFIAPHDQYDIINKTTGRSITRFTFSQLPSFNVSSSELNIELEKKENKGLLDVIIQPSKKHHYHHHIGAGRLGRWWRRIFH